MKRLWIALALALAGCSLDPDVAAQAATDSGLAEVVVGESVFLGCSKGDTYFGRVVEGTNPRGKRVEVTVCCGVWKDCTVRFRR